ncbi:MAG: hypothetical protein CMJ64_26835 [Planctomycetaceae bacterium]|nr:hypothetical protein [Planctomycetaceae bacterium]
MTITMTTTNQRLPSLNRRPPTLHSIRLRAVTSQSRFPRSSFLISRRTCPRVVQASRSHAVALLSPLERFTFRVSIARGVVMFFPGHTELLIILVIAVILFGHRLPSVARSIGESFHVFRRSVSGEDTQAS